MLLKKKKEKKKEKIKFKFIQLFRLFAPKLFGVWILKDSKWLKYEVVKQT